VLSPCAAAGAGLLGTLIFVLKMQGKPTDGFLPVTLPKPNFPTFSVATGSKKPGTPTKADPSENLRSKLQRCVYRLKFCAECLEHRALKPWAVSCALTMCLLRVAHLEITASLPQTLFEHRAGWGYDRAGVARMERLYIIRRQSLLPLQHHTATLETGEDSLWNSPSATRAQLPRSSVGVVGRRAVEPFAHCEAASRGCCGLVPPAGYARSVRPVCSRSEADGEYETAEMPRGMAFVRELTAL
jgi:hypothetical protein